MADATITKTPTAAYSRPSPCLASQAPTPSAISSKSSQAQRDPVGSPLAFDSEKARNAKAARRARWALLPLKQRFADELFMRGQLKAAGLRVTCSNEPTTVRRLKALLRRAGVHSHEVQDAVGTTLAGFLRLNPGLPLWAAAALVLESTGRFTPIEGGVL